MTDFSDLDRILGTVDSDVSLSPRTAIQWERPWEEDQFAANEAIGEIYEKMNLKRPKTVWAKSPRVVHEAIEMLRNIHTGQRHNFIDAMVPYDPDTLRREAQKTMLECLIERDLTVTMGAALQRQFPSRRPYELERLPGYLAHALQPLNLSKKTAPAGWSDAVIYSIGIEPHVLQSQTFCVVPYVKIAWMCSPGKRHVDDVNTVWTWADGYTVVIPHEEPEDDDEQPKVLEGLSTPRLPAPEESGE